MSGTDSTIAYQNKKQVYIILSVLFLETEKKAPIEKGKLGFYFLRDQVYQPSTTSA